MINNKLKTNLYLEHRQWYVNIPSPFWYSKAQFTFLTTSFYFKVGLIIKYKIKKYEITRKIN